MWRLIDALANLFDCSIAILFITRIIDSKRPRNKYKVFVAAMIAILALYIVTTVLNYLYLFEGILGFCYVIIMFAYAFFLLKGSALLSFIYPCFEILLKIVSSIITLFFVEMLLGKGIVSFISENSIEKLIIIIFEKISFFLVLQIVLKIHKKNKWELYFLEWMWILFVYIISFIIYC